MNATALLNQLLKEIELSGDADADVKIGSENAYFTRINDTFDLSIFADDESKRIVLLASLMPAPAEARGDIFKGLMRVNYDLVKVYGANLMIAPETDYLMLVKNVDTGSLDAQTFGEMLGEVSALGTALCDSLTDALKKKHIEADTSAGPSTSGEAQPEGTAESFVWLKL